MFLRNLAQYNNKWNRHDDQEQDHLQRISSVVIQEESRKNRQKG
jgi:hypothetical protein